MRLYHYRPIESALLEIGNCTFHFASRDELNDPIEGYVCVYWQGDKAAWEGLLRNYICSLTQAIELYLLEADEKVLRTKSLMVDIHKFDNVPMGEYLKKLGDSFLQEASVKKLTDFYGKNNLKCSKNEIQLVLRFVHRKALNLCFKNLAEKNLIPTDTATLVQRTMPDTHEFPIELLNHTLHDEAQRLALIKIAEDAYEDIVELQHVQFGMDNEDFLYGDRYENAVSAENNTEICIHSGTENNTQKNTENTHNERQHRNWLSIMIDFPKNYVSELENMIYPEGFVVCFSGKNDDSSMWGNYANSHKGVCLIYESIENGNGSQHIPVAINGRKTYCPLPVEKMNYGGQVIERNFFETFGRLTYNQIESWLTGTEGISECFKSITKDEASWRDSYWRIYNDKFLRKLEAWKHEDEYRMMISNTFFSYDKPKSRNIPYDPSALKGVIFGIQTSEYDKKRVVEALIKTGKVFNDIEFFQAEYDDLNQKINVRKMMWVTTITR